MDSPLRCTLFVFPGLVPGIHVLEPSGGSWMGGTSPAMTSSMGVGRMTAFHFR
jgi:hypothetical protein